MILAIATLMALRGVSTMPDKLALLTHDGTAMAESGICGDCYQNETYRQQSRNWALASDDYDGQEFHDVSGNEAIECQFCGFGELDDDVDQEMTISDRLEDTGPDW